jgi:hypothetical protein
MTTIRIIRYTPNKWWKYLFGGGKEEVFCCACKFFKREIRRLSTNLNYYGYYLDGDGGYSSEKFEDECTSPCNKQRVIGHYSTFACKEPIYEYPKTPQNLNIHNDCKWFVEKEKYHDWEVKD